MKIGVDSFKKRYSQLSTEDLLELYKDGNLVEEAKPILEEEIRLRGCSIPNKIEVIKYRGEKEKTINAQKKRMWDKVAFGIFLFSFLFYQGGGYEAIRDRIFPAMAAESYYKKGLKFAQKDNHVKAIEFYQKSKACNPKNPDIYIALGASYVGLGRFSDAVILYEKAIDINPESGIAYSGLATTYDLLKDYKKAIFYAEKSLVQFEKVSDIDKAEKVKLIINKIKKDKESSFDINGEVKFFIADPERLKDSCQGCFELIVPKENSNEPFILKSNVGLTVPLGPADEIFSAEIYACLDFDNDGKKEAVVQEFSGGAHCCFSYYFYRQREESLDLVNKMFLGDTQNPVFKDLDGDGKPEILTLDNSFSYFDNLCFAYSPALPIIFCYQKGKFVDCTNRFAYLLDSIIEKNLKENLNSPEYPKALAIEYLCLHMLQGKEKEGWEGIKKYYPNEYKWLKENYDEIKSRIKSRFASKI